MPRIYEDDARYLAERDVLRSLAGVVLSLAVKDATGSRKCDHNGKGLLATGECAKCERERVRALAWIEDDFDELDTDLVPRTRIGWWLDVAGLSREGFMSHFEGVLEAADAEEEAA